MADKKDALERQIAEIIKVINETRKRLPAHSTKPPIMMELLELEDKYEQLLLQLNRLRMDDK